MTRGFTRRALLGGLAALPFAPAWASEGPGAWFRIDREADQVWTVLAGGTR